MNFESSCGYLICPAHLEPKGECHCLRAYYRDMAIKALSRIRMATDYDAEFSDEYNDGYYAALDDVEGAVIQAFGHDEPEQESSNEHTTE